MRIALSVVVLSSILQLGSAGAAPANPCGRPTPPPSPPKPPADTWFLNDSNTKASFDCNQRSRVVINASHDQVTLTGKCTSVTLNGGFMKLTAESAEEVVINGADNQLGLGALGKLSLNGASNQVTWKTAIGGKTPTVSDLGSENSVKQTK